MSELLLNFFTERRTLQPDFDTHCDVKDSLISKGAPRPVIPSHVNAKISLLFLFTISLVVLGVEVGMHRKVCWLIDYYLHLLMPSNMMTALCRSSIVKLLEILKHFPAKLKYKTHQINPTKDDVHVLPRYYAIITGIIAVIIVTYCNYGVSSIHYDSYNCYCYIKQLLKTKLEISVIKTITGLLL